MSSSPSYLQHHLLHISNTPSTATPRRRPPSSSTIVVASRVAVDHHHTSAGCGQRRGRHGQRPPTQPPTPSTLHGRRRARRMGTTLGTINQSPVSGGRGVTMVAMAAVQAEEVTGIHGAEVGGKSRRRP
ncbi:hypothetical protein Dimus_021200 [Dionaea muscipula]